MITVYCCCMVVIGFVAGAVGFNQTDCSVQRLAKPLCALGFVPMVLLIVFILSFSGTLTERYLFTNSRSVLLVLAFSWAPLAGYLLGLNVGKRYDGRIT